MPCPSTCRTGRRAQPLVRWRAAQRHAKHPARRWPSLPSAVARAATSFPCSRRCDLAPVHLATILAHSRTRAHSPVDGLELLLNLGKELSQLFQVWGGRLPSPAERQSPIAASAPQATKQTPCLAPRTQQPDLPPRDVDPRPHPRGEGERREGEGRRRVYGDRHSRGK